MSGTSRALLPLLALTIICLPSLAQVAIDPGDPAHWGTLIRPSPLLWDRVFLWSNYHLEHHLLMTVPHYNLPRLHELLKQAMPDEAEVMAQAEVVDALRSKAKQNRLKAMIAIRGLLTPEQREKLIEIREERSSGRTKGPLRHCRDEIAELCPDAAPGKATLECLSGNWDELRALAEST